MKTLKFTLKIDAIESYIYSGHLFFILTNGQIVYSPISRIITKLVNEYPYFENIIGIIKFNNDNNIELRVDNSINKDKDLSKQIVIEQYKK